MALPDEEGAGENGEYGTVEECPTAGCIVRAVMTFAVGPWIIAACRSVMRHPLLKYREAILAIAITFSLYHFAYRTAYPAEIAPDTSNPFAERYRTYSAEMDLHEADLIKRLKSRVAMINERFQEL